MPTAYIALGSNLGNRVENCKRAIELLESLGDPSPLAQDDTITVLRVSPWYQTKAVTLDGKPQPDYCNGVVAIETNLSPEKLLKRCQKIEQELGRVRTHEKWKPRVVDLDILLYDNLVLKTKTLTIPHPEMTKRIFVLQPLCDIAAHVIHPVTGKRMDEFLT